MRPSFLVLSLLLLSVSAAAQTVQVSSTLCHTADVAISAELIERRLFDCGLGFANNVLWHLDRADNATGVLDGKAVRRTTGRGAVIYIMDTGVMRDHVEFQRSFGSNVIAGIDAGGYSSCPGSELAPCYLHDFPLQSLFYGHGTSSASVAAGARVGVAPDASIVSVMYRDAQTLDVALHEIIRHAYAPTTPPFRTGIINLSLSLGKSEWSSAVEPLIKRMTTGVDVDGNADPNGKRFLFTAAAGNITEGQGNQCDANNGVTIYPAALGTSIDGVIAVGGLDRNNALWSGSCRGPLVEVLAPAAEMLTASIVDNDTYRYKPDAYSSGTSWSAPFTAGMAARLLEANPNLTPQEIEATFKASPSRVDGLPVVVQIETPPSVSGRRRAVRH